MALLLAAIAYRHFFVVAHNTPEHNARKVTAKLEREIAYVESCLAEVRSVIEKEQKFRFNDLLGKSEYPYYVFSNKRVIFWSTNVFSPKYRDILGNFSLGLVHTANGRYLARKEVFAHESKTIEIVFLIPLVEQAAVVNKFLKNTYNHKLFTDSNFEISEDELSEGYQPIIIDGKELFSVKFGRTYSNFETADKFIIVSIMLLSLLSLVIFIRKRVSYYLKKNAVAEGFLFLLASLVILRGLMLWMKFPQDFVHIDLFDSMHYASSPVNPSLGDLLLNLIALVLCGNYIFWHYHRLPAVKKLLKTHGTVRILIAAVIFFLSFFWLAVHHQTMKTINYDSQWSMDITRGLEFDYLKVFGYAAFFISVVNYFLFAHVSFRLFEKLARHDKKVFLIAVAGGMALFTLFALLLKWDYWMILLVNLLFFFLIHYFRLSHFIGKIQYLTFIYFFAYGLPGAVIGVYANDQYNHSRLDFNKSRLADQLLVERNFFTELQLENVVNMIKKDIFIQKRILSPYASKLIIEKKVRREYLNNLNQFDIQIYVFNSRGVPFEQFNLKENYHDFRAKLDEFKTDIDGLYFVYQAGGQATTRYLYFIDIEDRNQVIGHILLDLRQKRLVPNSVFPLLLGDTPYNQQFEGAENFSYAVFVGKQLQYSYGEFNYRKNLPALIEKADNIFDKNVIVQGYNHKAFMGENERFVIVSAKEKKLGARLANYSFLFLVYVFTILIILLVVALYQAIRRIKLNYATRIQLYLNFAFFAPLIIVSATTVSIIIQTFKSSLESQYLEYAENLSAKIAPPLDDYRQLNLEREDLSEQIFQIAQVADLDVSVFNTNGRLISSSIVQIYQNEILSNNIEPRAYARIVEGLESAFVQEEQVGLLNFKNAYVSIRSYETGAVIGILSLPFFASQKDLESNVTDVMANIINTFTFVFIIFLFVSFFVSHGLTFPLRLITQKIKRTTLSSFNEPLSWNSDDEIGLMVTEYNKMLVNLEESKKALARSEKESAWREMARQVAHEIKNPLTPMKLTLQHMKRVLEEEENGKASEKKMNQINALLEQIETLSTIASSFSDFSKMPAPQTELLDVSALLRETIELYNKKEFGTIVTNIAQGRFMIEGDREWLGRAFSNLIINAFQSAGEGKPVKVEVNLFKKDRQTVRIEIKDNGMGIPENIRDKVFTPNFSTKYTGSGLGLAIARKGIEHANGKIWFDSHEGVGTEFYIELPLA